MIEKDAFFATACQEWRVKAPLDRNYDNFMIHFRLAEKEYNRQTPTSIEGSYHYVNAAEAREAAL